MNNKSKITTAPPNLWWVEQDHDQGGSLHAFPIVAIEHYYDDEMKPTKCNGSEVSEIIYLMSDGTTSKELTQLNTSGDVVFAASKQSAINNFKHL
jgi:hypothetical protein